MAKYNVYVVISDFKDFGDEGKKAACYSVNIYQPTKRKIPEDLNLHQDSGESSIFFFGEGGGRNLGLLQSLVQSGG